jgi:hypothetical protein
MMILWISLLMIGLVAFMIGLFYVAKYEGGREVGKGDEFQAEIVGGSFAIILGSLFMLFALWQLISSRRNW